MDRCPYCSSTLIWLEREGVIVCSGCGVVIDRIIDYSPTFSDSSEEINQMLRLRSRPRFNHVARRFAQSRRLYRTARRRIRGKYWLVIDYDKLFESGKFIGTIKHKATLEAEFNIEKLGLKELIEEGLTILKNRDPTLLCRSGRGRLALAYMTAKLVREGILPPEEEITHIFNISSTSYKRLVDLLKNSGRTQMPSITLS